VATPAQTSGWGDWHSPAQPQAQPQEATLNQALSALPLVQPVEKLAKNAEGFLDKHLFKPVAGALSYGHNHPQEAIMAPLQAGQRALRAAELNAIPGMFGGQNQSNDIGHAFMTPKVGPRLQSDVQKQLGISSGSAFDQRNPILGKAARVTEDVVNDPLTVAPIGKAVKLIPGATKAGEVLSKGAHAATGNVFNPDHYLRGLTPEARAQYEKITNTAMEAVRNHKMADDKIIAAHAAEIRKGVMPPEVASLFRAETGQAADTAWQKYLTDAKGKLKFGPGTTPQEVSRALFASRAPEFKAGAMPELEKYGFFKSPSGIDASRGMGQADHFTVPIDEIPEVQKRLARNVESKIRPESDNVLVRGAQGLLKRGNQAFLANPVPHTGNLSNLAYNEYGPLRTAQGLVNAGRVATGKTGKGNLAANIRELEESGTKSQYGNIFDEMGFTGFKNAPETGKLAPLGRAANATVVPASRLAAKAANKVVVPLERFSNQAQRTVLNSTETGLRSAALDAEKARGVAADQAYKNIHRTFGTNAPNAVTAGAQQLAVPFAHFHGQTAPGSVLRTIASNPARISNPNKIEQDLNPKYGAKYHSTVPGANAGRILADPVGYGSSNLGGLLGMLNPYSVVSTLKSGNAKKIKQSAEEQIGRFITGSPELQAALEIALKKKGQAGQSGYQDLGAALGGGYFGK
jgi:hypothetical protein